jgi:error-prone DNA polymerase
MGFYSASQLVQDLRRQGVEVRAVDVNVSRWDCSLEAGKGEVPVLRLGLRMVKGLSENAGLRIVAEREKGPYEKVQSLMGRAQLDRRELGALATSGALHALSGDRHKARWAVAGTEKPVPLFRSLERFEAAPLLKKPTEGQNIVADYQSTGLSLERHPMRLLRRHLDRYHYVAAGQLPGMGNGQDINVAGLVITKQRPGTASGVTFVTLEDESGHVNLIVWKKVAEEFRSELLNARLLGIAGELQIEGRVIHVIAHRLFDHSDMLGELSVSSRDFR